MPLTDRCTRPTILHELKNRQKERGGDAMQFWNKGRRGIEKRFVSNLTPIPNECVAVRFRLPDQARLATVLVLDIRQSLWKGYAAGHDLQ